MKGPSGTQLNCPVLERHGFHWSQPVKGCRICLACPYDECVFVRQRGYVLSQVVKKHDHAFWNDIILREIKVREELANATA